MARFSFSLEGLLNHRRRQEETAQRDVADKQRQANELMGRINEAQRTVVEQNRFLAGQKLVGKLDLTFIGHEKRYVGNLHVYIMQTLQNLALVERSLAAARGQLLLAARARQALEKLREKQWERFRHESMRREHEALDELVMQRLARIEEPTQEISP